MRDLLAQVLAPLVALLAVSSPAGPSLDVERAKSDAAGAVAYAALAVESPLPVPSVESVSQSAGESVTEPPPVPIAAPIPPAPVAVRPVTVVRYYATCSGPACRRGRLFRR